MRKILFLLSFFFLPFSLLHAQRQFWGTTSSGGLHSNGFIFKTDSIGDNLEIVHHFESAVDGENIGALLLGSNNKLYGLAASGGINANGVFSGGTFFEYDLDTDRFRVIQHFGPSNTDFPNLYIPRGEGISGLNEVSPGVLYGLMRQGNYVFSYNIATGAVGKPFTVPTYQGGASNSTLQNKLYQAFFKASDGFLYTSTQTNSSCPIPNPNLGSILRLNPANNTLTIRHKSSCVIGDGYTYTGNFVEVNGKLYSTAAYGGVNNDGVIYEYDPAANVYTKKYDFDGGASSYSPSSLVLANNGKLYGTAHGGGVPETYLPSGGGVLYEFDLSTNTFTKKHDFLLGNSWVGSMGIFPTSLVNSTNGKLYGVTEFGVFEYNTTTNEARVAGRFNNRGFAPSLLQLCRKPAYQYQAVTTHNICKEAPFSLDLASANTTTTVWKHNHVVDASKTTPLLSFENFTSADAGTWVCTLTNECGATVAQTITLAVNEPAQPTITAEGPLTFCAGEDVTLSAPEGFSGYTWSTGETSQQIVVSEGGAYAVSVNNGCESPVSEETIVTVHPLPAAPTGIEVPSFNTLKAIGTSDVYEWMLGDVVLEAQTSGIHVTESGLYKVRSISADGCRSENFASLSFTVTGTETGAEDALTIYPNPANGIVYAKINSSLRGLTEVSLFNATGKLVWAQAMSFTDEAAAIHIEHLPTGLYHLLIRKGERVMVRKIVLR